MSALLQQVLTFANVGAGVQVALAHNLHSAAGVPFLPDIVYRDNGDFSIDAVTTTLVTVTNNGTLPSTLNAYLVREHSSVRVIGGVLANLSPQPFIPAVGTTFISTAQIFRYTATGLEGTDFNVILPAARANDLYQVTASMSGAASIVAFDFPDILVGDRTTTQFRVVTSAELTAADQIDFFVEDAT
jgi:hypothetical protein